MDPLPGILRTIQRTLRRPWRLEFLSPPTLPPAPTTVRQSCFIFHIPWDFMQTATLFFPQNGMAWAAEMPVR